MQPRFPSILLGLRKSIGYGNNDLMTIITNAKKEAVLPPIGELKTHDGNENNKHFYFLAIRSCRFGTDRIGSTGVRSATAVQHLLMGMRGMLNITCASDESGTD